MNEIAVGAPRITGDDGIQKGGIWIIYIFSNFTFKKREFITEGSNGFTGHLPQGGCFGSSVSMWSSNPNSVYISVGSLFGSNMGSVWILEMNYTTTDYTNWISETFLSESSSSSEYTTYQENKKTYLTCGNISFCGVPHHCMCPECNCTEGISDMMIIIQNQTMDIREFNFTATGMEFDFVNISMLSSILTSDYVQLDNSIIKLKKSNLTAGNLESTDSNIFLDSESYIQAHGHLRLDNSDLFIELTAEECKRIDDVQVLLNVRGNDISGNFDETHFHIMVDGKEDESLQVVFQNNTLILKRKKGRNALVVISISVIVGLFLICGTIFILANKTIRSRCVCF
eukprot:TRINITY_DN3470_c0_g1_i5.p1 TRINITY_DN3470_c0_g1~~TRINITY_DN3470_c0_g1_i5.p1  ORF type:complete len:342 (+),score=56.83 TRINITY_DN3470_c0_g1_i5:888-1913(+)